MSLVTKNRRDTPVGPVRRPFSNMKRQNFKGRKVHTAAKVVARRRAKMARHGPTCGGRSGRRAWLRSWPQLSTQKGGKNNGRAPSYLAKPASR